MHNRFFKAIQCNVQSLLLNISRHTVPLTDRIRVPSVRHVDAGLIPGYQGLVHVFNSNRLAREEIDNDSNVGARARTEQRVYVYHARAVMT